MGNRSGLKKQGKAKNFKKVNNSPRVSYTSSKISEQSDGWCVEYSDKFGEWWDTLNEEEQIDVDAVVGLLERLGPTLSFPYSSKINGSRYSRLRELRIQHAGCPYRILYAFDHRRTAILLVGGDKTGDDRWYTTNIPIAEAQYETHLRTLKKEVGKNG